MMINVNANMTVSFVTINGAAERPFLHCPSTAGGKWWNGIASFFRRERVLNFKKNKCNHLHVSHNHIWVV